MKIEKLNFNKIKIIINNDDLVYWGVSADAVANNSPEVKEMLLSLLKQAEREIGFQCNNSRFVVEAKVSDQDDDLTLYVTRVSNDEEKAVFDKISSLARTEKLKEPSTDKKVIFEFFDFEEVIEVCYAINTYFGGSLYEYQDKYYIICDYYTGARVSEFGTKCKSEMLSIIEEHATAICDKNAFSIIRCRFKK